VSWKKAAVVLAGVVTVPASFFAGARFADLFDKHFLSGGHACDLDGVCESLGMFIYVCVFGFVLLVPAIVVWLRTYRWIARQDSLSEQRKLTLS
jgi:uncharacterized membrane protein YidH (DUF202 family)